MAVRAEGSTIWDAAGRPYLDAAGGAVVVGVGHGRRSIAEVMAGPGRPPRVRPRQRLHDRAARGLRRRGRPPPAPGRSGDLPGVGRLGGDRDRPQARPRLPPRPRRGRSLGRLRPLGELPRQHPRRARPVRAQAAPPAVRGLARPFPPPLGGLPVPRRRARRERPRARPRSWPPSSSGRSSAAEPGSVAAFVAEPIVGATLAAAVPPDGYWPAIAEVCRRHGVLLVADEVMTGFGRTGRWFAVDHWGVRPDLLVAAKGATLGLLAVRLRVGRRPRSPTRSSAPARSSTASPTATRSSARRLPGRSCGSSRPRTSWPPPRPRASDSRRSCGDRLGEHPNVGEIRGRGLMVGIELVADRATRAPFPRSARITEADRGRRPAGRAAGLLGDGQCRRGRRRRDPARAAVRGDRRSSSSGSAKASAGRSRLPSPAPLAGCLGVARARATGRGSGARGRAGRSARGSASRLGEPGTRADATSAPPIRVSRPPTIPASRCRRGSANAPAAMISRPQPRKSVVQPGASSNQAEIDQEAGQ